MGWTKRTSDIADRIGARAVERLIDHGVFGLSDTERHLFARACALAADDVIGHDAATQRELDMAHADGFDSLAAWRAWWRR